jgi:hypothetical protein
MKCAGHLAWKGERGEIYKKFMRILKKETI